MAAPYYRSLDGLRSVAVGIVLLAHAGMPMIRSGGVGVDIFFVLSGFLITSILIEESRHRGIHFTHFYMRRALRLLPCLGVACIFAFATTYVISGELAFLPSVAALTYTANWIRAFSYFDLGTLAHCWSLAIEEQYYLIWPLTILLLEKVSRNNLCNASALLVAALATAVYRYAVAGVYTVERIYFGLDTHMDGLILGSALAYAVRHIRDGGGNGLLRSRMLAHALTPVAVATIVYVMLQMRWWHSSMAEYGFAMVALASTVIIADLTVAPRSLLRPLFELAVLVYFGRISYGIYLLHFPLFALVNFMADDFNPYLRGLLKISLALAIAALSFHLIEEPFLRLKRLFVRESPGLPPNIESSMLPPGPVPNLPNAAEPTLDGASDGVIEHAPSQL